MDNSNEPGRHYNAFRIDNAGHMKEFGTYILDNGGSPVCLVVGDDECALREGVDGVVVAFGANSDWRSRHFVLAEAMKYFARLEKERGEQ